MRFTPALPVLFFILLGGNSIFAQPVQDNVFTVLFWSDAAGWVRSSSSSETLLASIQESWFDNHLPTYMGYSLQLIEPESDSLRRYLDIVHKESPECIEADPSFLEQEINAREALYIPILEIQADSSTMENSADIIFRPSANPWTGTLGVVHPAYPVGGGIQIEYWQKQTMSQPNWIAFYSTSEVLRHLLAGTIQAAAVPSGSFHAFLQQQNRLDLFAQFSSFTIPEGGSLTQLYLRRDIFNNILYRTLIKETWLRNVFSSQFNMIPLPGSAPEYATRSLEIPERLNINTAN
ncbi:MAG: hypothetical protein ACOX5R_16290 [bacterium]|jgi:hypothetical protein